LKKDKIPSIVIRRIPRYYRHLEALHKKEIKKISSDALALRTGLSSSKIRQDLAYFGKFGSQGYGYDVAELMSGLANALGMYNNYRAVVVGAGRLANALVANFPFKKYGITIDALYDIDSSLLGTHASGYPIYHLSELQNHCDEHPVDIAILSASSDSAHTLTNLLVECKVKGIWNFTNVEIHSSSKKVVIENVHFFDSLFALCCRVNTYDNLSEDLLQRTNMMAYFSEKYIPFLFLRE